MRWIWLVVLIPTIASGKALYPTLLVEGGAPIRVDGNLSEWEKLKVNPQAISNVIPFPGTKAPEGPSDLKAKFWCLADEDYLYVAVEVKDDRIVSGGHPYNGRWNEDCVEICFDGDPLHNPVGMAPRTGCYSEGFARNEGQIRVCLDGSLEGEGGIFRTTSSDFIFEAMPPYSWEALGVMAGVEVEEGGYAVEVGIPKEVLELEKLDVGLSVGLNVRVLDDDDGGRLDHLVDWAGDFDNLSYRSTLNYGVVELKEVMEDGGKEGRAEVRVKGKELEVEIDGRGLVYEAVEALWGKDYEKAIGKLEELGDSKVWPMLGLLYERVGEYERALGVLGRLAEGGSGVVRRWGLEEVAGVHLAEGEYSKAEEVYDRLNRERESPRILMALGDTYRNKTKDYRRAIETYRKIIESYPESYLAPQARYKIALCYRRLAELDRAIEEAQKALDDYPDLNADTRAMIECFIGRLYISKQEFLKGKEKLQEVIHNYPRTRWAQRAKADIEKLKTIHLDSKVVEWRQNIESLIREIMTCGRPVIRDGIENVLLRPHLIFGCKMDDPHMAFRRPSSMRLDSQGNIYIVDTGNRRVVKFDNTGKFLQEIGLGKLSKPMDVAFDPEGNIYVLDAGRLGFRVVIFDSNGRYLSKFRLEPGPLGGGPGPPEMAIDDRGLIYVNQPSQGSLFSVYSKEGKKIASFGEIVSYSNPGQHRVLNKVVFCFDSRGFLNALYISRPIFRRYDRNFELVFEKEIKAEEIEWLTERRERIEGVRGSRGFRSVIYFQDIAPTNDGGVVVKLIPWRIFYWFDKDGSLKRKLIVDRDFDPKDCYINEIATDKEGRLYGFTAFSYRIYRYE